VRSPRFKQNLEDAIIDRINIEYNISYIYHSMYAFFSRDNVALDGFAQFFKKESLEERSHAELLMDYQTKRGGKVSLQAVMPPQLEFEHAQKSCGLSHASSKRTDFVGASKELLQMCYEARKQYPTK